VPALPAKAPNFRDGQPANPDVADRPSNLVELERFDDRGNELHPTKDPKDSRLLRGGKHPLCQERSIECDQQLKDTAARKTAL
jgi:hypothetical protein